MNRQLKRVSIVVLLMFVALLTSTSILQVAAADSLNADGRNVRALYDSYDSQRGAILVAGRPVAQSVPSDDVYKYQREYPEGRLYSAVTGFFPINGEATGIEGALGSQLSGTSGAQFLERVNSILTGKNPQGASVELTIDPVAQKAAYEALGDLQGAVVVLQPKTGRILAMVSKPDFDPNELAVHDTDKAQASYEALLDAPGDPLVNKAIRDLNPPGSTFKLVVGSSALAGGLSPDTTFPNPARLPLAGTNVTVTNTGGGTCGGGGTTTIATAIILSCNIPMAELGMRLGSSAMKEQAEAFGFNHVFRVPMAAAESSFPLETDAAATAMSAFGQRDVRATALQMAMVSAAIGNGGAVMEPSLVESVRSSDFKELDRFAPEEFGRAVSPEVAAALARIMVQGVDRGAADNARIDGVSVAGKTGTAQHGENDPYTLWFTGFAPADDPEFAIAVVVENGGGRGQDGAGNTIAAPIARHVLEAVLKR